MMQATPFSGVTVKVMTDRPGVSGTDAVPVTGLDFGAVVGASLPLLKQPIIPEVVAGKHPPSLANADVPQMPAFSKGIATTPVPETVEAQVVPLRQKLLPNSDSVPQDLSSPKEQFIEETILPTAPPGSLNPNDGKIPIAIDSLPPVFVPQQADVTGTGMSEALEATDDIVKTVGLGTGPTGAEPLDPSRSAPAERASGARAAETPALPSAIPAQSQDSGQNILSAPAAERALPAMVKVQDAVTASPMAVPVLDENAVIEAPAKTDTGLIRPAPALTTTGNPPAEPNTPAKPAVTIEGYSQNARATGEVGPLHRKAKPDLQSGTAGIAAPSPRIAGSTPFTDHSLIASKTPANSAETPRESAPMPLARFGAALPDAGKSVQIQTPRSPAAPTLPALDPALRPLVQPTVTTVFPPAPATAPNPLASALPRPIEVQPDRFAARTMPGIETADPRMVSAQKVTTETVPGPEQPLAIVPKSVPESHTPSTHQPAAVPTSLTNPGAQDAMQVKIDVPKAPLPPPETPVDAVNIVAASARPAVEVRPVWPQTQKAGQSGENRDSGQISPVAKDAMAPVSKEPPTLPSRIEKPTESAQNPANISNPRAVSEPDPGMIGTVSDAFLEFIPESGKAELLTEIARIVADPKIPRQIAEQMTAVVRQGMGGPVELTLNPEELGRVRMTLNASDASIVVTLTVERPETADLMRRHLATLSAEFAALGYSDITFEFADRGTHQETNTGESTPETGSEQAITQAPEAQTMQSPRATPPGGLDLRL